ncbi:U-box domain-containing protein 19-like [Rhodamnia argentea]|uniref:RING-type E3 ubiquitin transferase n=1 Tax=Rhodamnia argentea TaxID=178133 RepID=A0A8B8N3R9_9MYRT|nr:U-box domain-containing protein 19-like [Rhodamnia argentea]
MTKKPTTESTRRTLTFPAVPPCDYASPSTILSSLTGLARSILAYKCKRFACNKRSAAESIRHVSNLLIFLEEVPPHAPGSIALSLSELHLALQQLRYLLEDCTRDGARVWMLMKSEHVADQFRASVRAMATALDVLPMEDVDVPVEAREVAGLFVRQARKVRFEVGVDDRTAVSNLNWILSRFACGIAPERSGLERVLDYVGVRSWSDCHKEIRFLDAELGFEFLSVEKREVEILSSLMGLMYYCRCMLFEVVDIESNGQSNEEHAVKVLDRINPDDFRCPISLELMVDPVTTVTGHTYDRASIVKWFRAGNFTCPKTGEMLASTKLVQNATIRRLIEQYCSENGIPFAESAHKNHDISRTVLAGSVAAEGAMKMLASYLAFRLEVGTRVERNKAAYEIRLLAKRSIFNRSCLVEAGTIPHLLKLLTSRDSSIQENAIAALLNLSKHSKSKAIIVENGGLVLVVEVLKYGHKVEARQHAAATLFYLASMEEYRKLIGEIPETIAVLVEMVKNGTSRGKKNALVAVFGLLMHHGNRRRVLASGVVPVLVQQLKSSDREDFVNDCLAVLSSIAENPEGTSAILHADALYIIMGILNSSTSRVGREHCVTLLLALGINGGAEVISNLVKSSSLMQSLYSLLSEGTSRASKKASALIRLLQDFSERRSCGSLLSIFQQDSLSMIGNPIF